MFILIHLISTWQSQLNSPNDTYFWMIPLDIQLEFNFLQTSLKQEGKQSDQSC